MIQKLNIHIEAELMLDDSLFSSPEANWVYWQRFNENG